MTKSDYTVARVLLEESLALGRSIQDVVSITNALVSLAHAGYEQGEYREARRLAEESVHLSRKTGDTWGIARALLPFALVHLLQGDYLGASPLFEESLVLSRAVGDKGGIAYALLFSGHVLFFQGQYTSARSLIEESLVLLTEAGDRRGMTIGLWGLGGLTLFEGDPVMAWTLYEESLALCRKINFLWLIPACLEGLARVAFTQGDSAWAARLWGRAESVRTGMGIPIPAILHTLSRQAMAAARLQLGEGAFTAMWAQGRTMTLDQVLAIPEPTILATTTPTEASSTPLVKTSVYLADLTPREIEVLRLVAQGLTNAQVAEQLVISRRTVNWYLTSIYSKLGVSSRSAATRYAIEHELA